MYERRRSPFPLIQEETKGAEVPRSGDPAEGEKGRVAGWLLQTITEGGWYPPAPRMFHRILKAD